MASSTDTQDLRVEQPTRRPTPLMAPPDAPPPRSSFAAPALPRVGLMQPQRPLEEGEARAMLSSTLWTLAATVAFLILAALSARHGIPADVLDR